MCLYTLNVKPLISDKDIITYKVIMQRIDEYFTPYQNVKVCLNSLMKPDKELDVLPDDYSDNRIGKGVIHSCVSFGGIKMVRGNWRDVIVKCIIKAGTPFYVDINFNDIASTELFITDKISSINVYNNKVESDLKETRQEIYELIRNNTAIEYKGNLLKIGDILLDDKKTFVAPNELTENMTPIGVVSFFYDDSKPHITALNQKGGKYSTRHSNRYCLEYKTKGTKEGDWYLPSNKEVQYTSRYQFLVNDTLVKIGNVFPFMPIEKLETTNSYWTSSEYSIMFAFCVLMKNANIYYSNKNNMFYIRPSLTFDIK